MGKLEVKSKILHKFWRSYKTQYRTTKVDTTIHEAGTDF